jgi:hypothetical protein
MGDAPLKELGSMCGKCDEIDVKIIRYKRVASQINDEILQKGLVGLLDKMEAEKAALHPERDGKPPQVVAVDVGDGRS